MKKVTVFITICYILSGIIGIIMWNIPKTQNPFNPFLLLLYVLLMLTPSIATFIVEKKKFLEITEKFQLNFKNINWKQTFKYLLITNLFIPILVMAYGYLLGNVLEIEVFGRLVTNYTQLDSEIIKKLPSFLKTDYLLFFLILMTFISCLLSSISVNGIIALGEEIGWRGFLEKNINLSFFKKNVLIGIIWGIWHAPIILCGHNYPSHPFLGIIMMVFLCIPMSFYFSFALKNTKCLFVIAALHGGFNATSRTLVFTQINFNDLFGPIGVLMILSVLTVFIIDYAFNIKNQKMHN